MISIDADLQHDPDIIPEFIRIAEDHQADVIVGTRPRSLSNMPFERFLTNHLTSLIISCFSGRYVRDSQSGYRYTSRNALRLVTLRSSRYDTESEFLFKTGRAGLNVWAQMPCQRGHDGVLVQLQSRKRSLERTRTEDASTVDHHHQVPSTSQ